MPQEQAQTTGELLAHATKASIPPQSHAMILTGTRAAWLESLL